MNLFYLDADPQLCAKYHCDKHVVKMITEHLQMMSVALDSVGLPTPIKKDGNSYKATSHRNHPCTIWVRTCAENFMLTYEITEFLCDEFRTRYGKKHAGSDSMKTVKVLDALALLPSNGGSITPPAQCMPDEYKDPSDPVKAYRNFYLNDKRSFATWTFAETPPWWV